MTVRSNARHLEALQLRQQGLSYGQIARRLGYGPYPSAARYAVLRAQQELQSVTTNSERTFGVEIEFFGTTRDIVKTKMEALGLVAWKAGRSENVGEGVWKITTDGSVTRTGTNEYCGLELVSPILKGAQGYMELKKALTALKQAGARVNITCGVHVHLGVKDLNQEQLVKVAKAYNNQQVSLKWLTSKSRRNGNNSYAHSLRTSYIHDFQGHLINNPERIKHMGRYYTLNLASYAKHGTFEFRWLNGSINFEKISTWIQLHIAFVEEAKTGTEMQEVMTFAQMLDKFRTAGSLTEKAVAYLTKRADKNYMADHGLYISLDAYQNDQLAVAVA